MEIERLSEKWRIVTGGREISFSGEERRWKQVGRRWREKKGEGFKCRSKGEE